MFIDNLVNGNAIQKSKKRKHLKKRQPSWEGICKVLDRVYWTLQFSGQICSSQHTYQHWTAPPRCCERCRGTGRADISWDRREESDWRIWKTCGQQISSDDGKWLELVKVSIFCSYAELLFDTGVTPIVMSANICAQLHLQPRDTNRRMKMTDGTEAIVFGKVGKVPITVGGITCNSAVLLWRMYHSTWLSDGSLWNNTNFSTLINIKLLSDLELKR